MAAYPSYDILLGSSRDEESGIKDDFAQSGSQHARVFHSQSYYRFRLLHALTLAQFKTLKSFYDSGKRTDHTLTYLTESPAVTYTVKFTSPPQIVGNISGSLFAVEVRLRGY